MLLAPPVSGALVPTPAINALIGIGVVSAISLVGVLAFLFKALRRHGVLLVLVAFAAGTLLGDSFFHLLPEAVEFYEGFPISLSLLLLLGFLAFFLLEGALRWGHAHGEEAHPHLPHDGPEGAHPAEMRAIIPPATESKIAPFAWTNLVGDGLHNFIDGALIATAFYVDPGVGIATTIAVAAHEIPQELGDFAVLLRAGLRPSRALLYNLLSAFMALLGGGLIILLGLETETLERYALPIIAGGFIYIAAADLVPELHHHTEGRFVPIVLASLLSGMALMASLLLFE
jgi:zinc and cadmium transporter